MNAPPAPALSEMVHIEVDIERSQETEFRELLGELVLGHKPRSTALASETENITAQAAEAFATILEALERDPATGRAPGPRQCQRLTRFLAALIEPTRYTLDLTDLRAMEPVLSRACLDCLNYFRLALQAPPPWGDYHRETFSKMFEKYGVDRR